jgi:uroporphyrinogen-III synthase
VTLLFIVIRPEPGCAATVAEARAMGLEAHGFPLFAVRPLAWDAPDPASVDALLIGSANAPRHAGAALSRYAGKPAYAVGEATAEAARAAGLTVVATGRGGLQALLEGIVPAHRRLLRLAGHERVDLVPPDGIELAERVVYASETQPMPEALGRLLTARALPHSCVALHSAKAARHFAAEVDRLAIPRARIRLVALAPRIAAAAGTGWASLGTASETTDQALLALAHRLCQ